MPEEYLPFSADSFITFNFVADMNSFYEREVHLFDEYLNVKVNHSAIAARTKGILKIIRHFRQNINADLHEECMICARSAKATMCSLQAQQIMSQPDVEFICDRLDRFCQMLFLFQQMMNYPVKPSNAKLLNVCDEMEQPIREIREAFQQN
jgi:hypothetical protein